MTTLLWIAAGVGGYFIGVLWMAIWDAFIGFGEEPESEMHEITDETLRKSMHLVYFLWPISVPIIIADFVVRNLKSIKIARINRALQKKKIRVAAEQETEKVFLELEEELAQNNSEAEKHAVQ